MQFSPVMSHLTANGAAATYKSFRFYELLTGLPTVPPLPHSPTDPTLRQDRRPRPPRQRGRLLEQAGGGETERRPGNQHGLQGPQEPDQRPQREHVPGSDGAADRGWHTTTVVHTTIVAPGVSFVLCFVMHSSEIYSTEKKTLEHFHFF